MVYLGEASLSPTASVSRECGLLRFPWLQRRVGYRRVGFGIMPQMKKVAMAAVLFAAFGARAEESVTNELQETSAPIVWGFGNYGFYSGY